jgi:hypothetical protein
MISGMVDGDGDHIRLGNFDLLKIDLKIAIVESTSKFDDANALAGTVKFDALEFRGKVIALGKLGWRDTVFTPRTAGAY